MAGLSFTERHYVPRLLWKVGEQQALAQTSRETRSRMTPLIEFERTKDPVAAIAKGMRALLPAWGPTAPVFLDANALEASTTKAWTAAQHAGLQLVPVLSTTATKAAATAAARIGAAHGVALRVPVGALSEVPNVWSTVTDAVASRGLLAADVHVLLDFEDGAVGAGALVARSFAAAKSVAARAFRTLTILASSIPQTFANVVDNGTTETRPRFEWIDWHAIQGSRADLAIGCAFGDYAVQNPEPPSTLTRRMIVIPTVRYTLRESWLISRGNNPNKTSQAKEYHEAAHRLARHPGFMGPDHCLACREIAACADGTKIIAGHGAWRRVATLHHLTLTSAQVAELPGP